MGLELSTFSTWLKRVESSSKLKMFLHIIRFRCFFALSIPASYKPPEWGARGGTKFHSISCPVDTACIEFSVPSSGIFLSLRSSAREP